MKKTAHRLPVLLALGLGSPLIPAAPITDILANGSAGPLSLTSAAPLSLSISLDPDDAAAMPADWWALRESEDGWFFLDLLDGWQAGTLPSYSGDLFPLAAYPLTEDGSLPPGFHRLYFGVDLIANGGLDLDPVYYDAVEVKILAAGSADLPDSGQSQCYDNSRAIPCPENGQAFAGQDAQQLRNPPQYQVVGDGTVLDRITGLVWQQSPDINADGRIDSADKLTYNQALNHCANLVLGGAEDWRLPDITTLYSLIHFEGIDPSGYSGSDTAGLQPFLDTRAFAFGYGDTAAGERLIDAQFASSTRYVGDGGANEGGLLFGVNFADGRIKGYGLRLFGQDKTFYSLCVRGNTAYGDMDYVDNGDGTITNRANGLMWSQDDSGYGMTWEQALAWVVEKNAVDWLGYNDWRLPDIKSLQSLVDYNRSPDTTGGAALDPLFDASAIRNERNATDYPYYWSSTTHANWSNNPGEFAAYVAFGRALGYMNGQWVDVHGAGAQRSDPKSGDAGNYPTGHGPQGDAIRIENYVRLVRDAS